MPNPVITLWVEPPEMDSGAPKPAVYSDATGLICTYVTGVRHQEPGATAMLRFEGVLYYYMGYPNDEALQAHPLYKYGLKHYHFHLVSDSPLIEELDKRNRVHRQHVVGSYRCRFRHWILTFHDETLEVIARSAVVVGVTTDETSAAVRQNQQR